MNKGRFGLDEFLEMIKSTKIQRDSPGTLTTALEELDHEGVGKIKLSDAEQAFRVMGEPFSQDEFLELITHGDPQNTGFIDIKLLTKTIFGR